eukprot:m.449199 g.449199  ORF g.449199 m.449199 type:complete len:1166 (+) comp21505_c1_seq45:218-3715(+)
MIRCLLLVGLYLSHGIPVLSAQHTVFVAQDGNEHNSCLSESDPCPSMTAAVGKISARVPPLTNVTIAIGEGLYSADCSEYGLNISALEIQIIGHPSVSVFDCGSTGRLMSLVSGAAFVTNIAVQNSIAPSMANGSAIHWDCLLGAATCSFAMENCRFYNNNCSVSPGGGSLTVVAANPTVLLAKVQIKNTSFSDNTAVASGGGLYIASHVRSNIELSDLNCTHNTAFGAGGCVAAELSERSAYSSVTVSRGLYSNNNASSGGAISISFLSATSGSQIRILGGYFTSNYATSEGGALSIIFGADITGTNISVWNGTYVGNTAGPSESGGGAINIEVSGNAMGCVTSISGGTYMYNSGDGDSFVGGALLIDIDGTASWCTTEINGGSYSSNNATYGGAVAVWCNANVYYCTVHVLGAVFTHNNGIADAYGGGGGAVYVLFNALATAFNGMHMADCIFHGNTALGPGADGGAVLVQSYTMGYSNALELSGLVCMSNSASGNGGVVAVYLQGDNETSYLLRIANNHFYDNDARYRGGAVYFACNTFQASEDMTIEVLDGAFNNNVAGLGGALAIALADVMHIVTNVTNCSVASSTAPSTIAVAFLGAAVNVANVFSDCTFTVQCTNFVSNESSVGVQFLQGAQNATLVVDQCTFNSTSSTLRSPGVDAQCLPVAIRITGEYLTDSRFLLRGVIVNNTGWGYRGGVHIAVGSPGDTQAGANTPTLLECNGSTKNAISVPENISILVEESQFYRVNGTALRLMLLCVNASEFCSVNALVSRVNFTETQMESAVMLVLSNLMNSNITVAESRFLRNGDSSSASAPIAVLAPDFDTNAATFVVCNSTVLLSDVYAEDNKALFGGVVYISTFALTGLEINITRLDARHNSAVMTGGVIYASGACGADDSSLFVTHSNFTNNSATSGSSISAYSISKVAVCRCTFELGSSSKGIVVSVERVQLMLCDNVMSATAGPQFSTGETVFIHGELLTTGSNFTPTTQLPLVECLGGYPVHSVQSQNEEEIHFKLSKSTIELNASAQKTASSTSTANSSVGSLVKKNINSFTTESHVTSHTRYVVQCMGCGDTFYQIHPWCGSCLQEHNSIACCHPCPEHANCTGTVGFTTERGFWPCYNATCVAEIFACPEGHCDNSTSNNTTACNKGRKPQAQHSVWDV